MTGLALLFYAGFVAYLLRLDRKQAPEVSNALWIPTIWMLYVASRPMAAWFMVTDDAASSPYDQIFLSGLLCLALCVLASRKVDWSGVIRQNGWLMILLGYMLASVFWSDITFVSFKRWIREMEAIVMALIVFTEPDSRPALESLLRRVVYIHIPLSVALVKYLPEYGVQFNHWSGDIMWVGVSTQKNGLGVLCFTAAFFLIWTLVRRGLGRNIPASKYQTYADVLVLAMTILLLRGPSGTYSSVSGYSSTSIAVLAIGLTTFFTLLWMKTRGRFLGNNLLLALAILIICYGTCLPLAGGVSIGSFTSVLGRDSTFTGRTEIWAKLVPVVKQGPILGCGFGGYWTPETRANLTVTQAHNGYLEVLMELGFVGLGLVSMFVLSCVRKAATVLVEDFDWSSLCISYVLMALLHNSTEASINSFNNYLTAIILFVGFCIPTVAVYPTHQKNEHETQSVSQIEALPIPMNPMPKLSF